MRKVLMSLLVAATVMTATSCDEEDVTPVVGKAKVKVIHASPDAPGVDLLVDNSKQNSSALTYLNSTAYLEVNEGVRSIKVNAAGTTNSVITASPTFAKDKAYSIFAANILSKIEPVVVEDNLATPAAGKAHVRFIHLSPDAPAVDIAVTGGAVLFPNNSFKGSTAFTPVNAGTINLEVRLAGTTTVALAVPNVTLSAGKIYTIYARGLALATPATLGASIIENN